MSKTWVVVVALLTGGGVASAGEAKPSPILGLPAPVDVDRPGAVMLHGGGRVTDDAFNRFVELAGGKRARIVLVPSAGYRRADYTTEAHFVVAVKRRYGSWFQLQETGAVRSVTYLHTDTPRDSDDPAFTKPLEAATGVWFTGGEQSRLNYRYVGDYPKRTRFQEAVRAVVARGGIVGGTSAGMAALPEIMSLNQERSGTDRPLRLVAGHGLGLFDGAIVEQHFDGKSGRLERFTDLLRDSKRLDRLAGRDGAGARMIGLAVETSSAVVLSADGLETVGARETHVFLKSPDDRVVSWYTLKPHETRAFVRDAAGRAALVAAR